jgi:hypothetical protein
VETKGLYVPLTIIDTSQNLKYARCQRFVLLVKHNKSDPSLYSNHVHWNVMLTHWEYSTYNRTKHTTSKQHKFVVEKKIFLFPWQWHPF